VFERGGRSQNLALHRYSSQG